MFYNEFTGSRQAPSLRRRTSCFVRPTAPRSAVVPANAGTHNHSAALLKQSGAPAFAYLLPVVMGPGSRFACPGRQRVFPRQVFTRVVQSRWPSAIRGRRESRAPTAPASPCAMGSKNAHGFDRYSRDIPAFPAQWFDGLYVLSPVSGLYCHRCRTRTGRTDRRQGRGARTTRFRRTLPRFVWRRST